VLGSPHNPEEHRIGPKTLFLAAALACGASSAQAAGTRLTCANGANAETTWVTINGAKASAEKTGWRSDGPVRVSPSLYSIAFADGAEMGINRDTGRATLSKVPGGPYLLMCHLGGPRS
jgi:hypothetical protein